MENKEYNWHPAELGTVKAELGYNPTEMYPYCVRIEYKRYFTNHDVARAFGRKAVNALQINGGHVFDFEAPEVKDGQL